MDPVGERMRSAFELHDLAVAMRRQVLARQHPGESAEQIEQRLRSWLLEPAPRPASVADPRP